MSVGALLDYKDSQTDFLRRSGAKHVKLIEIWHLNSLLQSIIEHLCIKVLCQEFSDPTRLFQVT